MSALTVVLVAASAGTASAQPGALDDSFGSAGTVVESASNGASGVALVPAGVADAGDYVMSGSAGSSDFQVGRFTSSGALDPSFAGGFVDPFAGEATAVAVVPPGLPNAGDVVAVGYWNNSTICSGPIPVVAELTPSGLLNPAFGSVHNGIEAVEVGTCSDGLSRLNAVTVESSGYIVVAGQSTGMSGTVETLVASLSPAGVIDWSTLAPIGHLDSVANGVTIDPATGDVITAGFSYNSSDPPASVFTVADFGTTGTLNSGFGTAGVVTAANQAGSVANAITALPDGNLVAVGSTVEGSPATSRFFVAQYTSAGAVDTSFGGGTGQVVDAPATNANEQLNSVAYQPFGGVLVAAGSVGPLKSQDMVVTQYDAVSGAVNGSFGSGGADVHAFPAGPSSAAAVVVQANGEMVVAGAAPAVNAVAGAGLLRLFGPTILIGDLPPVQITSTAPVTVDFPIYLDEPLYTPIQAVFCSLPGTDVDGQGQCATITIPAGTTTETVPVTVTVTTTPGNQQTVTLSALGAHGVAASPTQPHGGTATIQHLPPAPPFVGYRMVASDGGIFDFGAAPFLGSTGGITLNKPVVGMAVVPGGRGYWTVASDGGIFTFGAPFYGSTGGIALNKPVVGMAPTANGKGYWLVASDGGIFTFGDAHFYGSTGGITLNKPIVGMAATPDGKGYWLVAADGGIFSFGDAHFMGSTGGISLNKPVVGMAADPAAPGYWLVASDGGIFSFGASRFMGSTGGITLNKPVVGMASTPNGKGYWLVASDGGIFTFGNAPFEGSTGGITLNKPIVGMSS
jgi:uncharacterized delta-60 repeat protein